MKIVVGSTSPHKVGAVLKAVERLSKQFDLKDATVRGIKAKSGVRDQPFGLPETLDGAMARSAQAAAESEGAIGLGIESGVMIIPQTLEREARYVDLAVVYLSAPDGWTTITTSTGIEFPAKAVREALDKQEIAGVLIAKELDGDPTNCTSSITKGFMSRKDTFVQAVELALLRYLVR